MSTLEDIFLDLVIKITQLEMIKGVTGIIQSGLSGDVSSSSGEGV